MTAERLRVEEIWRYAVKSLQGERLESASVAVGDAGLEVGEPIGRCVMVTRPQPDGLSPDLEVMRTIAREENGTLAMGATVAEPGRIAVGDLLECRP